MSTILSQYVSSLSCKDSGNLRWQFKHLSRSFQSPNNSLLVPAVLHLRFLKHDVSYGMIDGCTTSPPSPVQLMPSMACSLSALSHLVDTTVPRTRLIYTSKQREVLAIKIKSFQPRHLDPKSNTFMLMFYFIFLSANFQALKRDNSDDTSPFKREITLREIWYVSSTCFGHMHMLNDQNQETPVIPSYLVKIHLLNFIDNSSSSNKGNHNNEGVYHNNEGVWIFDLN